VHTLFLCPLHRKHLALERGRLGDGVGGREKSGSDSNVKAGVSSMVRRDVLTQNINSKHVLRDLIMEYKTLKTFEVSTGPDGT
jgi:hypothetical protein